MINNGERDDILTLITKIEHKSTVKSLVISTLTKKFYLTASNVRDHHWDLRKNQNGIQTVLNAMHQKIGKVLLEKNTSVATRKERCNVIRKSVSFRGAQMTVADSARTTQPLGATKPKANKTPIDKRPPWK